MIASAEGGVEIEETAQTNPEAILRLPLHPLIGLQEHEVRRIGFFLGIPAELRKDFAAVMRGLYRCVRRVRRRPRRDQPARRDR